jgi:hypothetical protein
MSDELDLLRTFMDGLIEGRRTVFQKYDTETAHSDENSIIINLNLNDGCCKMVVQFFKEEPKRVIFNLDELGFCPTAINGNAYLDSIDSFMKSFAATNGSFHVIILIPIDVSTIAVFPEVNINRKQIEDTITLSNIRSPDLPLNGVIGDEYQEDVMYRDLFQLVVSRDEPQIIESVFKFAKRVVEILAKYKYNMRMVSVVEEMLARFWFSHLSTILTRFDDHPFPTLSSGGGVWSTMPMSLKINKRGINLALMHALSKDEPIQTWYMRRLNVQHCTSPLSSRNYKPSPEHMTRFTTGMSSFRTMIFGASACPFDVSSAAREYFPAELMNKTLHQVFVDMEGRSRRGQYSYFDAIVHECVLKSAQPLLTLSRATSNLCKHYS